MSERFANGKLCLGVRCPNEARWQNTTSAVVTITVSYVPDGVYALG